MARLRFSAVAATELATLACFAAGCGATRSEVLAGHRVVRVPAAEVGTDAGSARRLEAVDVVFTVPLTNGGSIVFSARLGDTAPVEVVRLSTADLSPVVSPDRTRLLVTAGIANRLPSRRW